MTVRCRLCGSILPEPFLDLGRQPLSNSFLTKQELTEGRERRFPLLVRFCPLCQLVQADEVVPANEIFTDTYAYFSSYSTGWLDYCEAFAKSAIRRFDLSPASQVIEIASNDGYLLQYFLQAGVKVLGIEPTANTAAAARTRGITTEICFFDERKGRELAKRGLRGDLVHAVNVLAHVPDLSKLVAGFPFALKPEGVLTLEFPHLLQLIKYSQFDTIYHEHYSYLSLNVLERVLGEVGVKIFDIEITPTHGGSLRLYCAHAAAKRPESDIVDHIRRAEIDAALDDPETYARFAQEVTEVRRTFRDFVLTAKGEGKRIAAYGAAAKGNTYLNSCGIGVDDIVCAFDRNPHKQGKFLPGSHLPILSPDRVVELRPDYVLILPWNIKDEIVQQLEFIKSWAGRFVVAAPYVTVLDI